MRFVVRMGIVYRHTVEAFLDQVVRRRRLFTVEELAALGAHPVEELPLDKWLALVKASAARLSPDKREEDALEDAGHEMVRGYRASLVGRSVLLVGRLVGPRGTLMRLPESYRTADSLVEVTATPRGANEVLLHYSSVFGIPTYVRGVLTEVMETLALAQFSVTFTTQPDGTTDYFVTWTK